MKKITLVLLIMVSAISTTFSQISSNCQNTCEVEKVIQEGAFLGVKIQTLRCSSDYHGVFVQQVLPNTAAEKFEFQYRDVILSVNGEELFTSKQMVQLIATYKPSDLVTIVYKRAGVEYEKDVVLGAKSTKIVKETVCCDDNDTYFNDVNVSLYPNPTTSEINISMEEAQEGKYTFQVFNSAGEEVSVELENFDAGFSKKIDLSNLSAGEYFLKVSKGHNAFTKAFIIAK